MMGEPDIDRRLRDRPVGRLAVLICADAWQPEAFRSISARGAQVVAVPSFSSPSGGWAQPWQGYNGAPAPEDVDPTDVGGIALGEAWERYAMAARAPVAGIRDGINVFLRGPFWEMGSDGHTVGLRGGEAVEATHVDGGALTNIWL